MVDLIQVDAFATEPFSGNPAAVCLLDAPRSATWMQKVAAEMNLSETAFLWSRPDEEFDLRWFTPAAEVDLCGHATLASAHVLWERDLRPRAQPLGFHTRSGRLTATADADEILLDFPAQPATAVDAPQGLAPALGVSPRWVGRNRADYLVELDSEADVRGLRPDIAALGALDMRGLIVTAAANGGDADFVSRFFAPAFGIDEDPVTGSAHCCLAPFWRDRLGRDEMRGFQASSRGGWVGVRVAGDRVRLAGRAVTVFTAQLLC